jgi:phosphopentomutase
METNRVFLIVLDSFGIGQAPDAADYNDGPCNTLGSIASSTNYKTPMLQKLGLFNIEGVTCGTKIAAPLGAFGRLREKSKGKDTTIGHWEISGIISEHPLPTYPNGFPPDVIKQLEDAFGRKIICNKPYSGTAVIHDYGQEQLADGALIIYTSADSVLQIAAHEDIISPEQLYDYCRAARRILTGKHSVGRVIARPFTGSYPNFERTPRRHDFSMMPPANTMLDSLTAAGLDTIGVGKISDIFAARGVQRHIPMSCNEEGMNHAIECLSDDFRGLCFINLVDFDMKFGHRRDIDGYAQAATDFDKQLIKFLDKMKDTDVLMITADHGCDPGAPGTDHTREYVPYLVYGKNIKANTDLKTSPTFANIAATVLDLFHLKIDTAGQSFVDTILK